MNTLTNPHDTAPAGNADTTPTDRAGRGPHLEFTTVRLNAIAGIFLLGLIVVGGNYAGVPENVLTGIASGGFMLLKDIVQADNRHAPQRFPVPSQGAEGTSS